MSKKKEEIKDSEGYEIYGLANAKSKKKALEILDRHSAWWQDHHIEIQNSIEELKKKYEC